MFFSKSKPNGVKNLNASIIFKEPIYNENNSSLNFVSNLNLSSDVVSCLNIKLMSDLDSLQYYSGTKFDFLSLKDT